MSILILEFGCNHEGSLKLAEDMIYVAHELGANIVKFQLYNPLVFMKEDHILYPKRVQILNVMRDYYLLIDYAHSFNLKIGFSIFTDDFWQAVENSDYIKIAARQLQEDLTYLDRYLEYLSQFNQNIFVSWL